ncbi:2-dehydro-3-deoxyphosphooctonate aldolase [Autumnicola edwardsiae]|uniref:2-dehydro-3-deoxyphosphooctonate aldolase n=1 Tax=Autumnicola edwardsiae TaxID=3075594 RepID=A0ABU3CRL7_9FLAO|nr:2-dehydro-3-deoxyphosphooctonate aldolase [Zunongwangia sp. F297]MDT0648999.1 2-dehydro-3-deoxyphosphooctonate aldolase [Zunongwangia sp. F297]
MNKILFILTIVLLASCGTQRDPQIQEQMERNFGVDPRHPVIVGSDNLQEGPRNQQDYLNNLSGPNGEVISYERIGSCCEFKTKNGILGGGMLDKYEVNYDGLEEPIILYFNMYDPAPEDLKVPTGLLLKE